jgi:2-C-methyl-D-erythritol 4-phosphate cytidylyltransferase
MRYRLRTGDRETQTESVMTLWKRSSAWLAQLWQWWAAEALRQALDQVTERACKPVDEAPLLHPRCCRTEHFQDKR